MHKRPDWATERVALVSSAREGGGHWLGASFPTSDNHSHKTQEEAKSQLVGKACVEVGGRKQRCREGVGTLLETRGRHHPAGSRVTHDNSQRIAQPRAGDKPFEFLTYQLRW